MTTKKTDSEISTDSDYDPSSESIWERLYALRDMVPATTRGWLHAKYTGTSRVLRTGLFFLGRSAWTLSVSALLVGIPFALAWGDEQNLIAMEQEARMREMGGELLTAGAEKRREDDIMLGGGGDTASQVGAALGGAKPAL